MTKTECHYCKDQAIGIKLEATVPVEETDVETIEQLPVCQPCSEYWYDGSESYPALLPL